MSKTLPSPEDIAQLLRSAFVAAARPANRNILEDERARATYREMAVAVMEPLLQLVPETDDGPGGLTYETVVYVLAAAAFYAQLIYVLRVEKLPAEFSLPRRAAGEKA